MEIPTKTQGFLHLHPLIIECALVHPFTCQSKPELQPLFYEMRRRVPQCGDDWLRVMAVASGPGLKSNYVPDHSHIEHAILYYVEPTSPIVIEGDELDLIPGQFVYVAPGVRHLVKRSSSRRVVVAMLVAIEKYQ